MPITDFFHPAAIGMEFFQRRTGVSNKPSPHFIAPQWIRSRLIHVLFTLAC
jgi:hypothetical protein